MPRLNTSDTCMEHVTSEIRVRVNLELWWVYGMIVDETAASRETEGAHPSTVNLIYWVVRSRLLTTTWSSDTLRNLVSCLVPGVQRCKAAISLGWMVAA